MTLTEYRTKIEARGGVLRPYELLARLKPDGTVAGLSVRYLADFGGDVQESPPFPLAAVSDPAYVSFAAALSASAVAERDQLATALTASVAAGSEADQRATAAEAAVATLTAERDALATDLATRPPAPGPNRVRVRDLMNRLGDKWATVVGVMMQSPATMAELLKLLGAEYVERDDPVLTAKIAEMVAAGLLTEAEVAAALA